MSGGGDLFGALPEELLHHVLSFLPSREAVKSSLLSRRWRHLWRSTPAVRVRGNGDGFRLFVNSLIVHRDATPLRSFEIDADLLIPHEHPLRRPPRRPMGQPRPVRQVPRPLALVVRLEEELAPWRPWRPLHAFASPHLTRIHLDAVYLVGGQLDFSCCPALLRLALVRCRLEGDALVSPSLERLAIVDCHSEIGGDPEAPDEMLHTILSTPRLCFLEISGN
ncbi:hypothetical protein ACQ4PT_002092 [Festuca glaucescens]